MFLMKIHYLKEIKLLITLYFYNRLNHKHNKTASLIKSNYKKKYDVQGNYSLNSKILKIFL